MTYLTDKIVVTSWAYRSFPIPAPLTVIKYSKSCNSKWTISSRKKTQNQILSHSTTESFRLIKVAKSQKVFSISSHLQNSVCQLYPLNTG